MTLRELLPLVALALLAALASVLTPAGQARAEERVLRIAGSDSMAPFLERRGEEVSKRRPGLRVEIDGRGSSTGPSALLRGDADLAAMTRPMQASEFAAFQATLGALPKPFAIALDAVAVFVNERNPLEKMTLGKIDAVFSRSRRCGAEGPIDHWGGLGLGEPWTNRRIGVYVTPSTSGTQGYFRAMALCRGSIRQEAREQPGTSSLVLAIAGSRFGIGYGSRSGLIDGVKAVALQTRDGSRYATIADADLRSGAYPLSRELFLYGKPGDDGKLGGDTATFVAFALSEPGQKISESFGFLRLAPARAAAQRASFD